MRLVNSSVTSNSSRANRAGNQNRVFNGISGRNYDVSFMARVSEAADAALGDTQCSLSISNQVNRTTKNKDDRTSTEKLFAEGNKSNAGISVYFTKEDKDIVIAADRALNRYFAWTLEEIKRMEIEQYAKSSVEMIKMAAVREARSALREMDVPDLTVGMWDMILSETNNKAEQVGINTFELSIRASSRDQELQRDNSAAWKLVEGEAGIQYYAGVYNAAGTKTLPLFTDRQVEAAKRRSEEIFCTFEPAYSIVRSNSNALKEYLNEFCRIAAEIGKKVPNEFKQSYNVWTEAEKAEVSKRAGDIVKAVREDR